LSGTVRDPTAHSQEHVRNLSGTLIHCQEFRADQHGEFLRFVRTAGFLTFGVFKSQEPYGLSRSVRMPVYRLGGESPRFLRTVRNPEPLSGTCWEPSGTLIHCQEPFGTSPLSSRTCQEPVRNPDTLSGTHGAHYGEFARFIGHQGFLTFSAFRMSGTIGPLARPMNHQFTG